MSTVDALEAELLYDAARSGDRQAVRLAIMRAAVALAWALHLWDAFPVEAKQVKR